MCSCKKKKYTKETPLPEFSVESDGSGDAVEMSARESIMVIINGVRYRVRVGFPLMLPENVIDALIGIGAPVWKTS